MLPTCRPHPQVGRIGGLVDRFTFYAPYAHDPPVTPATEALQRE
ncbi:hypothetical protein [Pseudonocardia adelaidensis]